MAGIVNLPAFDHFVAQILERVDELLTCEDCDGRGIAEYVHPLNPELTVPEICHACKGTGRA